MSKTTGLSDLGKDGVDRRQLSADPVLTARDLGHDIPGSYLTGPTDTSVGGVVSPDTRGVGRLPDQEGPRLHGQSWSTVRRQQRNRSS